MKSRENSLNFFLEVYALIFGTALHRKLDKKPEPLPTKYDLERIEKARLKRLRKQSRNS